MVPSKSLCSFSQEFPVLTLLLTSFVSPHSSVIAAAPAHRRIVGWDDAVTVCGPWTVSSTARSWSTGELYQSGLSR